MFVCAKGLLDGRLYWPQRIGDCNFHLSGLTALRFRLHKLDERFQKVSAEN